jgi:hypothetical protein
MPSPKHSASTGTQQPNTADSQGPDGRKGSVSGIAWNVMWRALDDAAM